MSPPEVWGPAIWTLFHTLAERITEEAYPHVSPQLFKMIMRICKFLPCPECSMDATNFLAKIKMSELKTKLDFKNAFYLFHNYVNAKKRKKLFNYSNMYVYSKYRIIDVVNNFIAKYHTKGNMKLLTESFQRQFIINDFKKWFTASMKAFVPRVNIPPQITCIEEIKKEEKLEDIPEITSNEIVPSEVITPSGETDSTPSEDANLVDNVVESLETVAASLETVAASLETVANVVESLETVVNVDESLETITNVNASLEHEIMSE